ncbi:unnamed protein product [Rotaria socialis]
MPKAVFVNIPANAKWAQKGKTIAKGNGGGGATNQLYWSLGLFVDDDQTVVIADNSNGRIMQWKKGDATNGQIVAGGKDQGNGLNQLQYPTDILIDIETDSLIICDYGNRRVVRWPRQSGTTQGEILIDNIDCYGLAKNDQRSDKNGTLVAGGNGKGADCNQLNGPGYIFVDRQQAVYVSDHNNHRVMKWNKGATEGTVVAGGQGEGSALTHLHHPEGLVLDTLGTLSVSDSTNHRVMRWPKGATQGTVIVGGNGEGEGANQFNRLIGLSFDRHGNLYIVDDHNHRVQRFSIQ